jgi:hypothetical protein
VIEAEHRKWARFLFNPYINHLLKTNFNSFYLINKLPRVDESAGLIITPNHFSWWDGFIIDFISRKLIRRKIHIMMLEEQLKKYWFFRKVGAYSVNLTNPVSTARTMKYTNNVLKSPRNFVVLYPQGKIQSFNAKSIIVKEGLRHILNNIECELYVLPLALKVEYGNNKNPDVIAQFGSPLQGKVIRNDFNIFIEAFINNIEKLKNCVDFETSQDLLK